MIVIEKRGLHLPMDEKKKTGRGLGLAVLTKEMQGRNINNNYSPKWRWLVLDIYRGREANSEIIEHKMMIFNSFTVANDYNFGARWPNGRGWSLFLSDK